MVRVKHGHWRRQTQTTRILNQAVHAGLRLRPKLYCQLFLSELCDVLDVPRPAPQVADDALNAYVFEKPAPLPHGTSRRIDLYKRGCFVLEAKQGSDAWEGR